MPPHSPPNITPQNYGKLQSMSEVKSFRKQTVLSTKPVQPGKFAPLSVLDRVMERNHVRIVLYYQLSKRIKTGELVEKLKESLSESLSAFPVVVGRLLRTPQGHWTIKCNDAGIRLVQSKVKGTLEDWLVNVDREKELKLTYWEEMFHKSYFWSTFYVQITEFEGAGLAIGLSCAHLVSDPICAIMMIKAWADMTIGGKMLSPPLYHPLPPRRPAKRDLDHQHYFQLINHYQTALENSAKPSNTKKKTATLLFNQEMVMSCISMAEKSHNQSLTTFEALTALFWMRISKVKGAESSLVDMSLCLDMRKELGLDRSYFGNCMVYNKVKGDGLHANDELSKAALAINQGVSEMDYDGVMDLIEWLEKENIQHPPLMSSNNLVCFNLENVDSCYAVFEAGASPVRVSYYIEPAIGPGQVVIFPSPKGGGEFGRVVMVTLSEGEVEKLLDDSLIKQFATAILMN